MELPKNFIDEVCEHLNQYYKTVSGSIDSLENIPTGADTTIFSFEYTYNPLTQAADSGITKIYNSDQMITVHLILRIYTRNKLDDGMRRASWEFEVLKSLASAGLLVPKVHLFAEGSIDHAYIVMDLIEGEVLTNPLREAALNGNPEELLMKFMKEMANLHKLNLTELRIPFTTDPPLPENSTEGVRRSIYNVKVRIQNFELTELYPVIQWIEDQLDHVNSTKPVLIHGDYHPSNIIVKPSGDFVLLDWSNIAVTDFRMDLGFTIGIFAASGFDLTDQLKQIYENLSNRKVEDLEYFVLLANFNNFMRVYSIVNNYEITGETKASENVMIGEYGDYAKYLLELVTGTSGVEIDSVRSHLNKLKSR